jgi:hypothetical protein
MPKPKGRTVFDRVDKTQLYYQKGLNVKLLRSEDLKSSRKLSSAIRRAVFPCSHYRRRTFGTFGKTDLIGKVFQPIENNDSPMDGRCPEMHALMCGKLTALQIVEILAT